MSISKKPGSAGVVRSSSTRLVSRFLNLSGRIIPYCFHRHSSQSRKRLLNCKGKAMSSHNRSQLWNPSSGIRFALKAAPASLYPQLDLARFLHIPNFRSSIPSSSINHDVDTAESRSHDDSIQAQDDHGVVAGDMTDRKPDVNHIEDVENHEDSVSDNSETEIVPPTTPLPYNISSKLFFAARKAAKESPESFWSHIMYEAHGPDDKVQKVKVHYCTSRHTTENVCKKHFLGEKVVGFDMEWLAYATKASSPRENVSLIQLASPGHIGLFHVALYPRKDDLVAPTLQKIMEDASVSKVGVNIQADCTRLKNNLGIQTNGIFELSHLYKLVKYSAMQRTELINKKRVALAIQVEEILHLPLYKGDSVRSSDWTLPLSGRQINYSAADAYAGLQLYYVLEEKRKQLKPTPPRPEYAELGKPIQYIIPDPETSSEADEEDVVTPIKPSLPAGAGPPTKHVSPHHKTTPATKDYRIMAADAQTKQYRDTTKRAIKTTPSSLRAYYIWHSNADLNPESIAKLLRDPPLKTNTVTGYILNAISAENLPYSKSRLKDEVLASLPADAVTTGRYRSLAEACRDP